MPDAGLDVVTMGGVLVTSAHWPQSPRPTLMERRCWVAYTASLLPLWGWWRRTRIRAGNDFSPTLVNPLARVWWNTPGIDSAHAP